MGRVGAQAPAGQPRNASIQATVTQGGSATCLRIQGWGSLPTMGVFSWAARAERTTLIQPLRPCLSMPSRRRTNGDSDMQGLA